MASPHYRWLVVALTVLNQAISVGILIYSFALFVVPWLDEFEVSRGQLMIAIFLLQMTVGFASPVLGRWLDTYSIRVLVVAGGVATGLGLFALSQATAFWQIVVIHMTLLPLGMVLCGTLASQTIVSKLFTENRGVAIGVSAAGTSLGGFVFPLITAALIAQFGWQTTLIVLSLSAFLLLVPANLWILRIPPPAPRSVRAGDEDHIDARVWADREILSTRMFWIPVAALMPMNAAFGGVQFNLGAYVSDLGFEQAFAAQLIAITSLGMIGGKFLFGWLGDRVDHRRLYWGMAVSLALAMGLYLGAPDAAELRFAALLQGIATGGVMPMMGIVYSSRFGTLAFGKVLGYVNLFLMMGSFGSILSGWLFDVTGSYDYAFLTFLALVLPCAVAMYWLPSPAQNAESAAAPADSIEAAGAAGARDAE